MSAETKQETQTWWRVSRGADVITSHEVVHVTPKTLTFLQPGWNGRETVERRTHRDSSWEHWFDNEKDAVEYVRSRLVGAVNGLRSSLQRAEDALAAFNEAHPLPATEE